MESSVRFYLADFLE